MRVSETIIESKEGARGKEIEVEGERDSLRESLSLSLSLS